MAPRVFAKKSGGAKALAANFDPQGGFAHLISALMVRSAGEARASRTMVANWAVRPPSPKRADSAYANPPCRLSKTYFFTNLRRFFVLV
jgi:hypothetical protein